MKFRQWLKFHVANKPTVYQAYARILQPSKRALIIREETELVIDGFSRSANTFAVVAFETVQIQPVVIAHHTHAPATIKLGCQRGLPVLLLIRDAMSSVSSAAVFHRVSPLPLLKEWIWFYKNCLPFINQIVVASFEEVTNNYDVVINRVNKTYSKNFALFRHEQQAVDRVIARVESISWKLGYTEFEVARPSDFRNQLNEQAKYVIAKEKKLLNDAQILYDQFTVNLTQ